MALHPQDKQRLESYIKQYTAHGYSLDQIHHGLLAAGWPEQEVAHTLQIHRLAQPTQIMQKPKKGYLSTISAFFERAWFSRLGHRAILALTSGVVITLISLFVLPSDLNQAFMQLQVDSGEKFVSLILVHTLIVAAATSFLLGILFHYKLQERYGLEWIFFAALIGTLLAIIGNFGALLGTAYYLLLPVTITASALGLQFLNTRKNITHRIILMVIMGILLLGATLVLNGR